MKTKLLLILTLFLSSYVVAQNLVISEIFVNPSGSDSPFEYIELRGDASATIAAGTYLIQVEGDGFTTSPTSNPGDIESGSGGGIIDLSGLTLGSNGYLVLLTTGEPYTANGLVDANASVVYDLTDGDLEGQSHTFILLNASTAPSSSDDIDDNDDGEPNGTVYDSWTVLDSFAFLDDDDADEFGYASVGFYESANNPTLHVPAGSTYVATTTQYDYAARNGMSAGSTLSNDETTSDWFGGDVPSNANAINDGLWSLSSTAGKSTPASFGGQALDNIGGPNPSQLLSVSDLSISNFNIYPNPAKDFITIETHKSIVNANVEIYSLLGKRILETNVSNSRVDVKNLAKGMYLLKLIVDNNSVTKKIIIE